MHPEQTWPTDIDALSGHRVLRRLHATALQALAAQAQHLRCAPGELVLAPGQAGDELLIVLAGRLELDDPDLGWTVTLEAGDWFGAGVSSASHLANGRLRAVDACDLLKLPAQALASACAEHPGMTVFFPTLTAERRSPSADMGSGLNLLSMPMRALVQRAPVTLPPTASIREAAECMKSQRVSSVLLVERGLLFGLVTDRDLRNRVLATGMDTDRPVADIATLAPLTVQAASPAFEALTLMARHNIHHVPVMEGGRIAGMVTATNLTEQHSTSAVYLAGDIHRQSSVEGLARASSRVGALQKHLAAAGASADSAGRIITSITDAVTTRLIQLAEAQLGPAPIDYVWVAAGSQARSEQTAKTDQDNCLVLDDSYDEARHGAYFRDLSRFVCDGLAACGYVHCPGEMMAMTDKWRQPRHRWTQYFHQWIDTPEPMALMLTSVFFDLRAIHGRADLLDSLRHEVLQRTKGHSLFLSHMVGNALKHRPPLGLFGHITLLRGEHAGTLDLKHSGIVPIVDLARVYALAGGLPAVNTQDRLAQAAGGVEISEQAVRDLHDALELLGRIRMAHQVRQMDQGQRPDNFLALGELSNLERRHLKNAFGVVQQLQSVLGQRYGSRA